MNNTARNNPHCVYLLGTKTYLKKKKFVITESDDKLTKTKTMSDLVKILNEDFNHDVLEFDVHHGCHSFLLRAHQRGPKDDAQVGHGHQVELALRGNSVERRHIYDICERTTSWCVGQSMDTYVTRCFVRSSSISLFLSGSL